MWKRSAPAAVGEIENAQVMAVLADVPHERVARAHTVGELQVVQVLGVRQHRLQTRLAHRRTACTPQSTVHSSSSSSLHSDDELAK